MRWTVQTRRSAAAGALLALSATLWGQGAMAQQATFNAQSFSPAVGPNAIFSLEGADTLEALRPTGGLMLNYGSNTLVAQQGARELTLIDQQLALEGMVGVGLPGGFQVDLVLPVYLVNEVLIGGAPAAGLRMGDLTLRGKYGLLSSRERAVGLALMVEGHAPTGDETRYVSDGQVAGGPRLIADTRFGPLLLVANVGARFRRGGTVGDLTVGHELTYGLGAEVAIKEGLVALSGEVFGRSQLQDNRRATNPVEGLLGVKLHTPSGISLLGAAGRGLVGGYGAPVFRALFAVSYVYTELTPPPPPDTDGDGIVDERDACPSEPEDMDGFEDEDGCPDLDNDQDGVPDAEDKCPDEPGVAEFDGCAPPDADSDGVPDAEDACPEEAGPAELAGCPDADGDGVADINDACADVPGLAEHDGCLDSDGDGLADHIDQCPDEAETFNGVDDEDGCPDGDATVLLTQTEVKITQQVFFDTGAASIQERSFLLLDTVATVLQRYPQIEALRVEGHTDDVGDDAKNLALSQARAQAVKDYLISKGVASERLTSEGYGEAQPACEGIPELLKNARKNKKALEACRADNRRVAFKIVAMAGAAAAEAPEPKAPEPEAPASEEDAPSPAP